MFNLQGSEVIILLLLALVVLGPEKLPDAIRRFTRTYAELRKMGAGFQEEFRQTMEQPLNELRGTADTLRKAADPAQFDAFGRPASDNAPHPDAEAEPAAEVAPEPAAEPTPEPAAEAASEAVESPIEEQPEARVEDQPEDPVEEQPEDPVTEQAGTAEPEAKAS